MGEESRSEEVVGWVEKLRGAAAGSGRRRRRWRRGSAARRGRRRRRGEEEGSGEERRWSEEESLEIRVRVRVRVAIFAEEETMRGETLETDISGFRGNAAFKKYLGARATPVVVTGPAWAGALYWAGLIFF